MLRFCENNKLLHFYKQSNAGDADAHMSTRNEDICHTSFAMDAHKSSLAARVLKSRAHKTKFAASKN